MADPAPRANLEKTFRLGLIPTGSAWLQPGGIRSVYPLPSRHRRCTASIFVRRSFARLEPGAPSGTNLSPRHFPIGNPQRVHPLGVFHFDDSRGCLDCGFEAVVADVCHRQSYPHRNRPGRCSLELGGPDRRAGISVRI
jgi:hypothetical protein